MCHQKKEMGDATNTSPASSFQRRAIGLSQCSTFRLTIVPGQNQADQAEDAERICELEDCPAGRDGAKEPRRKEVQTRCDRRTSRELQIFIERKESRRIAVEVISKSSSVWTWEVGSKGARNTSDANGIITDRDQISLRPGALLIFLKQNSGVDNRITNNGMSLTSVTLKQQEILARDLRFTSSHSKVKQEGQEQIQKTFGWEFFKINSPGGQEELSKVGEV
ncbi:hypothetical protein B0H14DRAFT_2585820 [Mycena olivaceomarginata]|nr:hypothetical protein B0H14DRAFT_2585820 [Mycena olivaceomarginata]